MISVTEAATKKFLEIVEAEGHSGHGLRVTVHKGGTASPEFALDFVDPKDTSESDVVHDTGQLKVYMDPSSAKFLEDGSVDFIETVQESGFKIEAPNAGIPTPGGPVAEAVQRVLQEKINPAIASHGGVVALIAVEEETAYLQFGGGCQGCGMVSVTLKQGVEKVLFEEVPQITKVLDVTDHAAGTNPYYQPSK